ncbi:MAG: hypothetical protein OXF93_18205 [Acidobacteria bacterium]|nr:hypothetical protein [Acidobacteriota bacterium]
MECLRLPEPAGRLWVAKRDIFRALEREERDEPTVAHLGGGTILAARWRHRRSTDIDITFPGRRSLTDLLQEDGGNLVARLGGGPERVTTREIELRFPSGRLHIALLSPTPHEGQAAALVNDREAMVLSSAQILRGKLDRADDSPVRDAFDVISAASAEPAALAVAVSALPAYETQSIPAAWRRQDGRFAGEAAHAITGVPEGYETDREKLGTGAAEAMEDHRYRSLRIEVAATELKIVKSIGRGTLPPEVYALNAAHRALVASGLEAHFDNNGPFLGSRLQRAVGVMAKHGRTGVLYDSADRRTTDYVLRPEQHFSPGPS